MIGADDVGNDDDDDDDDDDNGYEEVVLVNNVRGDSRSLDCFDDCDDCVDCCDCGVVSDVPDGERLPSSVQPVTAARSENDTAFGLCILPEESER